jgi:hypothetical protein
MIVRGYSFRERYTTYCGYVSQMGSQLSGIQGSEFLELTPIIAPTRPQLF